MNCRLNSGKNGIKIDDLRFNLTSLAYKFNNLRT